MFGGSKSKSANELGERVSRVLSYDQKFSDFVMLNCDISPRYCNFLIDTQADISVIKQSSVYKDLIVNHSDSIEIRGITDDPINTIGSVYSYIDIEDLSINHKLSIVPDSFNIPSDGILGKDFIKNFNSIIEVDGEKYNLKLHGGPDDDTLIIPPRCEIVRKVTFNTLDKFLLVPNQEVGIDVFTANTIVKSDNAYLRFVNVGNDMYTYYP